MAGRAYSTEAIVLRSIRLGESDRVLHLYTEAHGRVGAVAKGVRKTMSRFGARLEPLSHVELVLHRGRSELQTVTAAQLVRSHREAREDYYRFFVGTIGAEAMLRLFSE
jgi:DNA repair protein RecO (recombination protein O)